MDLKAIAARPLQPCSSTSSRWPEQGLGPENNLGTSGSVRSGVVMAKGNAHFSRDVGQIGWLEAPDPPGEINRTVPLDSGLGEPRRRTARTQYRAVKCGVVSPTHVDALEERYERWPGLEEGGGSTHVLPSNSVKTTEPKASAGRPKEQTHRPRDLPMFHSHHRYGARAIRKSISRLEVDRDEASAASKRLEDRSHLSRILSNGTIWVEDPRTLFRSLLCMKTDRARERLMRRSR
jgi:hypothetical protein